MSVRVEQVPKLDAPRGSPDRAWHLAVAESQPTHLVTRFRFTIDLDSGALSVFDVFNGRRNQATFRFQVEGIFRRSGACGTTMTNGKRPPSSEVEVGQFAPMI